MIGDKGLIGLPGDPGELGEKVHTQKNLSLRHGSALVYRDGMASHLKNPIFTVNLLPILILTTKIGGEK